MSASTLTISEILGHKSALMDLPTFFKACGMAQSTGYQIAADGRLPLEVIPLGRRRFVRTVEAWRFLGLVPEEAGPGPACEAGPAAGNDEEAACEAASPVEQSIPTSK
ncbi:helix-turn-helix domain-containing protein [Streptomyces shenzhenensis]|uniref:helix-turn-helix domain-containing protein n=1 Tax=Streptomyces shenzhenensis TaxID=943815 RepID=UPI003D92015C